MDGVGTIFFVGETRLLLRIRAGATVGGGGVDVDSTSPWISVSPEPISSQRGIPVDAPVAAATGDNAADATDVFRGDLNGFFKALFAVSNRRRFAAG